MKKTLFLVFYLCSIFLGFSQSNNLKIIYKSVLIEDATSDKPDVQRFIEKSDAQMKNISFELLVNNHESFFKVIDKVISEPDLPFYKMALALSGANNKQWYVNTKENKILNQYVFMGDLFLIESNVDDIKWTLTEESKIIAGYKAYKATCYITSRGSKGLNEKLYEVWYTPQIGVSTGPLGLVGLPGLILEVKRGRVLLHADSIEVKEVVNIKELKNGEKMTEDKFNLFASKKMADFKNRN